MEKKLIAICVLTLSAVALMLLNFAKPAVADEVATNRDYTIATARVQGGGEGLYVVDNRTGLMAIFSFDTSTRTVRPRAVRALADAFK